MHVYESWTVDEEDKNKDQRRKVIQELKDERTVEEETDKEDNTRKQNYFFQRQNKTNKIKQTKQHNTTPTKTRRKKIAVEQKNNIF